MHKPSRRLRAPRADASVLQEPPLTQAPDRLAANRAHLASWNHDFQGRSAGRLRAMARHQALEAARTHLQSFGLDLPEPPPPNAPWFVTGHQPELFHPGVWVKNFATGHLARQSSGVGLNLIVDNDTPKWASIRVPTLENGELQVVAVDFDDWATEVPYEDWSIANPERFLSFPDRVRAHLGTLISHPVLDEFYPHAVRASHLTDRVGLRFSAARRAVESSWGLRNWDVPLSALCRTESFGWFASHLLAQLPQFQSVHNQALLEYRRQHGIRSKNHPVPALDREDDWLEAPFWVWRRSNPRRRPLLARQKARELELRIAGEPDAFASLPLAPDREACCAVEALGALSAGEIRIRTRALTTTMFARLLLGDLFIHGIGGSKYDELGDAIIRGFFQIEPPEYLTLSMTLWLGLPTEPADPDQLAWLDHDLRDLTFNPDRHLLPPVSDEQKQLIEAKKQAIAGPQDTHRQRADRYFAIRRINEALSALVADQKAPLQHQRAHLAHILQQQNLARGREFAFVLHDRHKLQAAFQKLAPAAIHP